MNFIWIHQNLNAWKVISIDLGPWSENVEKVILQVGTFLFIIMYDEHIINTDH